MDDMTKDMIPRKAVEYCLRKETVSTNPEAYKAHKKFIGYMDDPEISQFGHWMHANGYNCALVSVAVDLEKIPSAQPDVPDTNVGDMISRQAAIALFEKYGAEDDAVALLESLPPAQPGWIPCSPETMPKTEEKVLITCEYLDIYGKPHRYVCKAFHVDRYTMRADVDWWDEGCDEYREEDDQYYVLEGWYEYIHNWGDYSAVRITEDKVVAWCELPTPYREGGQE